MASSSVARLVGDRFERRARDVARPVPRVRPTMAPRAYGSQYGAPRPTKAGTTYTPPVSRTDVGERLGLGRVVDDAEPVAQPLHGRAGDEDAPSRQYVTLPLECPSRSSSAGRSCEHGVLAGVHQHEAAGAVGVLRHARREAGLAEGGRLLVARDRPRWGWRRRGGSASVSP